MQMNRDVATRALGIKRNPVRWVALNDNHAVIGKVLAAHAQEVQSA